MCNCLLDTLFVSFGSFILILRLKYKWKELNQRAHMLAHIEWKGVSVVLLWGEALEKTHQSKLVTRNKSCLPKLGTKPCLHWWESEFLTTEPTGQLNWVFSMTDNHDCYMRKVIHRSVLYYLDRLIHAINKIRKKKCYANLSLLQARNSVHFAPFEYMFPIVWVFFCFFFVFAKYLDLTVLQKAWKWIK